MSLSIEDAQAFLAAAADFSQGRIAPLNHHPHQPLAEDDVQALSLEAQRLGLLPQFESGFALWEHGDSAGAMAFNLGFLQTLAEANASLAFAWHRQSLAISLLQSAGVTDIPQDPLALSLLSTGRYGLGRLSFGHYLALPEGSTPAPEHSLLLADYFDRRQETVLLAPPSWQALIWPVWQAGAVQFCLLSRRALSVREERRQHGLDELRAFILNASSSASTVPLTHSKADVERLLKQDLIGLLAIGAGSLARAARKTEEFTALRQQGGQAIKEHPAVMRMLASIQGCELALNQALTNLTRPISTISLSEVLHLRLSLQPRLCESANEAMQAHGGLGYMRDIGIEKVVREQNTLRLLAGGLLDGVQMLAGLNLTAQQG